ncbi:hypothetical protein DKX38_008959 [Salix brachista]|uniref:VQ domain-containing protein n=1 Tax=Salix brachista TaxID=2182728 RepID=A0A5N5M9K5_9ROSI|nr:hypothetical protein DKX38_008959 [Salix brachista]
MDACPPYQRGIFLSTALFIFLHSFIFTPSHLSNVTKILSASRHKDLASHGHRFLAAGQTKSLPNYLPPISPANPTIHLHILLENVLKTPQSWLLLQIYIVFLKFQGTKLDTASNMASSENLASLEPRNMMFKPTFPDLWFSEAYARDTETLTKALQKTLFSNIDETSTDTNTNDNSTNSFSMNETFSSDSFNPFTSLIETAPPTPTASNVSGSDPETAGVTKRQRNSVPGATGKVTKRKTRASKRSQTTFIAADPANFRQMVQQVTGVRFGNSQVSIVPVSKPEPPRPGGRFLGGSGYLPTLDTSAFLLDHHQQQVVIGSTSGSNTGPAFGPGTISFSQPMAGDVGAHSSGGLDFDTFSSFPTLESWKVV